jgi:hypothetical protein
MDINRNQVWLAGLVLLFLGIELRAMDSVVLNQKATRMLADQGNHPVAAASNAIGAMVGSESPLPPHTIHLPDWIGWSLLSLGAVMVLHSWTMAKPG